MRTIRVVLADDDETMRRAMVDVLTAFAYGYYRSRVTAQRARSDDE